MSADGNYEVKVTTKGDPSGANEVTAAVTATGKAADKASALNKQNASTANDAAKGNKAQGAAAEEAGKKLLSLGEVTEKGVGIGRQFAEAAKGNVFALLNVTSALKVTGAALKTNLIGGVLLAVTAFASWLQGMRSGQKDIEKTGEAADQAADKVEELANAVKKAGEAKTAALAAEMAEIRDSAKGAADELQRVFDLREKLNQSKTEAALAKIDANPNMSATERAVARQRVIDDSIAKQREDDDLRRGREWEGARGGVERAGEAAAKAREERDKIDRRVKADEQAIVDRADRRRALERERDSMPTDLPGSDVGSGEDEVAAAARMRRRTEIDKALKHMDAEDAVANSDARKKEREEWKSRRDKAQQVVEKAEEERAQREADFTRKQKEVVGIDPRTGRAILDGDLARNRRYEDDKRKAEQQDEMRRAKEEDEREKRRVHPDAQRIIDGRVDDPGYSSKSTVSRGDLRDAVGNVGGRAIRRNGTIDAEPSDEGKPEVPPMMPLEKNYNQMARDRFAAEDVWRKEAMRRLGISESDLYKIRQSEFQPSEGQEFSPPPPLINFERPDADSFLNPKAPAEEVNRASKDFYEASQRGVDYTPLIEAITGMKTAMQDRAERQQREIDDLAREVRQLTAYSRANNRGN